MCFVGQVAYSEIFVQNRMFYSLTLWKSFIRWIIIVIIVLCRSKNFKD